MRYYSVLNTIATKIENKIRDTSGLLKKLILTEDYVRINFKKVQLRDKTKLDRHISSLERHSRHISYRIIFKKSFTNISLFIAVKLTRFEINEKLIYSGYSLVFDGAGRLSFGNFLLVML